MKAGISWPRGQLRVEWNLSPCLRSTWRLLHAFHFIKAFPFWNKPITKSIKRIHENRTYMEWKASSASNEGRFQHFQLLAGQARSTGRDRCCSGTKMHSTLKPDFFFFFFITTSCIFLNIVTFFPPFFFEGLGTQVSTEECKRKARCTRQPRLAEGCRRLKDSLLQENTVQPGFVLYRGCVSKRGCC